LKTFWSIAVDHSPKPVIKINIYRSGAELWKTRRQSCTPYDKAILEELNKQDASSLRVLLPVAKRIQYFSLASLWI